MKKKKSKSALNIDENENFWYKFYITYKPMYIINI